MSDGHGHPDSTDLFRMLVEGLPVVAYVDASTPDPSYRTTTTWVSPRIEQLTGYTQQEWVETRPWRTILHPDDRDWVLDLHRGYLESGAERFEAEYRLVRKDAGVVWVRDVESLVLGPDGSTRRRQGSWEDMTDRVRADERRHRSERLYRVMAESVPDGGFALFDGDLRYSLASGDTFRRLGVDPERLEGVPLGAPDDPLAGSDELVSCVRRAFDGSRPELDTHLGGRRLHARAGPVGVGDEIVGVLVMVLDVTERMETELRAGLLAANFPGGIALFDRDLRYTFAEGKLLAPLHLIGMVGTRVGQLLDRPELAREARSALEGTPARAALSARGVDIELEFGPVRDAAGNIVGGMVIARDVTERNAAQAALGESEARREHVLAAMLRAEDDQRVRIATDLHDDTVQVMTAALLSADRVTAAIERGDAVVALAAAADYRETLGEAMDRTRRLMFELRPPTLEASGLSAALTDLLERAGREAGFTAHVDCPSVRYGETVETLAYRTMLEGVANIRKHARARNVWLVCREQLGRLEVSLRDDGIGFDAESAATFDRRLHIGLDSISERVRLAGGRFATHSTPGEGTILSVSLPVG
jgi:PAS domain S-box-containing protein